MYIRFRSAHSGKMSDDPRPTMFQEKMESVAKVRERKDFPVVSLYLFAICWNSILLSTCCARPSAKSYTHTRYTTTTAKVHWGVTRRAENSKFFAPTSIVFYFHFCSTLWVIFTTPLQICSVYLVLVCKWVLKWRGAAKVPIVLYIQALNRTLGVVFFKCHWQSARAER